MVIETSQVTGLIPIWGSENISVHAKEQQVITFLKSLSYSFVLNPAIALKAPTIFF